MRLTNSQMRLMASFNGITLSLRQLNRILRSFGLFRRHHHISPNITLQTVQEELKGSSSEFGYRLRHQKVGSKGLNTDRESVRIALKCLHPDGVKARTPHRFRRRIYVSSGPNFTWHIDGYDKLKPYGLAIHGALDGYSRKLLWLEVSATKNNPKVVSSFFLNTVKKLQLIPRCIRSDRGSENVIIGGIQRFFRRNHTDNLSNRVSFRYGPSTRNQRIESWWSITDQTGG